MSVTAAQLAGALCCCADSLFNNSTTADSSTLALDAASVLVRNARAAVIDKVRQAVTDVHAASLVPIGLAGPAISVSPMVLPARSKLSSTWNMGWPLAC